ncbi:putative cytochrome P450 [Amniculicola lignicola CBS 123094]|uniref:Putative cytochrome P450 n=1 Tax=Amniculicola lignicola CBS 123094 TaxID=1392246 RepID=A0A6A5WYR7_9PLEO|nr:putative cytochrome P450 [Amniculicola lignicola CBS 123094]
MDSTNVYLKSLVSAAVTYIAFKIIQRLYFHPLSDVPGPWYAAISTVNEFWWNCIQSGQYMFKIEEMHKEYGPVIRINPWEVHINDPAFMDTLWANSKMEKDPFYYRGFGAETSVVTAVTPAMHKLRRGAMAQLFSKASVAKLEPRVLSRVEQLCRRIEEHKRDGKPVDISNAYRCLATDVVTDYAVPKTRNYLDHPDFNKVFNRVLRDVSAVIHWNRHIPFIMPLIQSIPREWVAFFDKDGTSVAVIDYQTDVLSQAKAVVDGVKTKKTGTVLDAIYQNPSLPPQEKTFKRIADESFTIINAGSETTGNTLANVTYNVLANPFIHHTLKSELKEAAKDHGINPDEMLPCRVVESLPYLRAVINEALRMATGVCGRLPRRNPSEAMTYTANGKTHVLPPGTVVSMSIYDIHFNPAIFPNPHSFDPFRWLAAPSPALSRMEKYLVPFGKGARQCVGLELAKQQILLTVANLFWKFDLELFKTTERDVRIEHDFFAPFGPSDSKGVRVVVTGG